MVRINTASHPFDDSLIKPKKESCLQTGASNYGLDRDCREFGNGQVKSTAQVWKENYEFKNWCLIALDDDLGDSLTQLRGLHSRGSLTVKLRTVPYFLPFSLSWVKTLKLVALNDLPQVVEDHILGDRKPLRFCSPKRSHKTPQAQIQQPLASLHTNKIEKIIENLLIWNNS